MPQVVHDGLQEMLCPEILMSAFGESTTGSHSVLFYLLKHLCLPLPLCSSKYPLSQHEKFYFFFLHTKCPFFNRGKSYSLVTLGERASSLHYGRNLMVLSRFSVLRCSAAAAAAVKSLQSCLTLYDPIDGSPPGSPAPGILQARTLEWVAISFSNAWKRKVRVKSLSHVWVSATPWTAAYQAPPSMGFSRQEDWSGCLCLLRLRSSVHNRWIWKFLLYSNTAFVAKSFAAHANLKLASVLHFIFHENKCPYQSRHLKPWKVRTKVTCLERPKKKEVSEFPKCTLFLSSINLSSRVS